MIEVSKHIEIDAGHRVPDHKSKCRSPHGHRYKIEATVAGSVLTYGPETGMVIDFGRLKELLVELVHEPWDHASLVYVHDYVYMNSLGADGMGNVSDDGVPWKVAVLDRVPTAENLAEIVAERLYPEIVEWNKDLHLVRVTVWETPTCSATWRP